MTENHDFTGLVPSLLGANFTINGTHNIGRAQVYFPDGEDLRSIHRVIARTRGNLARFLICPRFDGGRLSGTAAAGRHEGRSKWRAPTGLASLQGLLGPDGLAVLSLAGSPAFG